MSNPHGKDPKKYIIVTIILVACIFGYNRIIIPYFFPEKMPKQETLSEPVQNQEVLKQEAPSEPVQDNELTNNSEPVQNQETPKQEAPSEPVQDNDTPQNNDGVN